MCWNEGGELAGLIVPAATAQMLEFWLLNCGVFATLETSPRNRSERLPLLPNMMLRNNEASNRYVPGPTSVLRPASPN